MIAFLKRMLWSPPEEDEGDKKLREETTRLGERSKELDKLQESLKSIREASEEKMKVLQSPSSPQTPLAPKVGDNGREITESIPP